MNRFMRSSTLLLVITVAPYTIAQCVIPADGMTIVTDTTFCPGNYELPNGIIIGADHVTLDGNGAGLNGNDAGYGLRAEGRHGFTVRDLIIRRYFHGMHIRNCSDVTITNCRVWLTPELPEGEIFLNIFDGPNGQYAHAIWLRNCARPILTYNNVTQQQNGISLFECTEALVAHNECSYNTGWGISLYNTDDSVIRDNTADYCTRDYYGWSGADAASLLIVYGSCNNQILDNSLVGGGDGVFLAGATHQLQRQPNNNNYFARNDCSYSPNNGFEATFSQYNVFEDNISDYCNYGYWLGYSSLSEVRGNRANYCTTAGIAIEHGHQNLIENNELRRNDRGVWLWTDEDASLVAAYPECRDSWGYQVAGNWIAENNVGIRCDAYDANRFSYDYTIENNAIDDNTWGTWFTQTTSSTIRGNFFRRNTSIGLTLGTSTGNLIYNNYFNNPYNAAATQLNSWTTPIVLGTNIVGGAFLGGNYWSDYTGSDTNGDGLGDTLVPHFSSGIIQGGDSAPLYFPDPDCNLNGVPDASEPDCDADGVPDSCEASPDCNLNGRPDECELEDGSATDLNNSGILDECEYLGDLNCSGVTDFSDINAFVLALSSPAEYAAAYPLCSRMFGDINGDGDVTLTDVNPFVNLMVTQ
jgi:parallel beta-helix repeat protein